MSRKKRRKKCRNKDELQEALDLFNKAIEGDVDAFIKIWKIVTEDEAGGEYDGNYE
jgi:hypothetical protein